MAALRLPLALGLAAAVALGVLFGHRGRIGFAIATQGFLLLALVVIVEGVFADPAAAPGVTSSQDRP